MLRHKIAPFLAAAAAGIGLTSWGVARMDWTGASLVPGAQVLLGAISVLLLCRAGRFNPLAAAGMLAALFAAITGMIWPLLVTLWFALASTMLGWTILRKLSPQTEQARWSSALLVGAGVYGTIVGLIAHFPVSYPGLYGLALAVPVVTGRSTWIPLFLAAKTRLLTTPSSTHWHDLAIAAVALVHFAVALMPEVGHDALAMHLFIPAHLLLRHQWEFDFITYIWAVMPTLGDWIYAIGYLLAGETASRLFNIGFILLLAWLIRDLVIWAGGTVTGARWAVLVYLATPLTFTESSSLFVESIWSAYVVAGTLALLRTLSPDEDRKVQLPLAGMLLGCALAAKAVTFTVFPALLLLLVAGWRKWRPTETIHSLGLGAGLLATFGAPPYITAWMLTGNPVFPFFNRIFQSPFYPPINFDSSSTFGRGIAWDSLYQMTINTGRYLEGSAGAAGFQWLLLFIPASLGLLLTWHRRGLALLAVATISAALAFQAVTYLRYIFPSFALAAACIGVAISGILSGAGGLQKTGQVLGCLVIGLNLLFFRAGTYYGDISLLPLLSPGGRTAYLQSRLPLRNAVEVVNRLNVRRTPVAVFAPPLTAGLSAHGLYPNWYNASFKARINSADSAKELADALREQGVNFIIVDAKWGSSEKREQIEAATEKLADLGAISVRRLPSKESK